MSVKLPQCFNLHQQSTLVLGIMMVMDLGFFDNIVELWYE